MGCPRPPCEAPPLTAWRRLDRPLVPVGAGLLLLLTIVAVWYAAVQRGVLRWVAALVGVVALAGLVVILLGEPLRLVVAVGLLVLATGLSRVALGRDLRALRAADLDGHRVPPAARGVLIMNLRSGGGKVERFNLEAEARGRGVEPIVLRAGDDLRQLAVDAAERGADVIGMAGGDGSQALVASVAMERGLAHVCVPAGTRNHLALDLGLDRDDVVGALDAFGEAVEVRIDLARVGDRIFVNNASLGVYAEAVRAEGYREAKARTITRTCPSCWGQMPRPSTCASPGRTARRRSARTSSWSRTTPTAWRGSTASAAGGASTPGRSASSSSRSRARPRRPGWSPWRAWGRSTASPAGRSGTHRGSP